MATTLEEVHEEAFLERQKAAFMDDPTIATPGTVEEAEEGLAAQVMPRRGPIVQKPESGEDLEHNPYATVAVADEDGNVVEPGEGDREQVEQGDGRVGDPSAINDEDAADGVDTQYDRVNTTNDISIVDPEDRTEDQDPLRFAQDAEPGDEVSVQRSDVESDVEDEDDDQPSERAAKPAWVNYAVRQGADKEEAEALTKAELIEQYG
jgi:hypothetical protein